MTATVGTGVQEAKEVTPPIEVMKKRLDCAQSKESHATASNYSPRPNDVLIATPSKAGTTWMQQICHQLRSSGDMEFEEISHVAPWFECAHDQGKDLEAPQWGDPKHVRLFKSHWWNELCPNFPKIVTVIRDPADVVMSFYKFLDGWYFDGSELPLETFADSYLNAEFEDASYFLHLAGWYKRRNDPEILFVFFEDLKEDLPREVERVAKFLSSDSVRYDSPENIKIAVEHSTYKFMKENEDHFLDKAVKANRFEKFGIKAEEGVLTASKVRSGAVGQGSALSSKIREKIQQKWNEEALPLTGCANYDEFRKAMFKERA